MWRVITALVNFPATSWRRWCSTSGVRWGVWSGCSAIRHRLGSAWCGVTTGHADTLVFEPQRVYLSCGSCGRETTGWRVAMTMNHISSE